MSSRDAWADLLAAHLTRPAHVGSVVVLAPAPRLWPLAEWRAPVVWAHLAPLHGDDFHAPAGRHPARRERLHPERDAAALADHLRRADLRLLRVTEDANATARLAAAVPAALWATRSLLLGRPEAPGWHALHGLTEGGGWQTLPLPGLRALASPDVAAALAEDGLALAAGAHWGTAQAQRLGAALPPERLVWPATDGPHPAMTLHAPGAQALVCTEPGHAWHVMQQGHAVVSPSGKAQLWLPYEGSGSGHYLLAPLNAGPLAAVVRQGPGAPPAVAWQAASDGAASGQALLVPAGGSHPLLQLDLPLAALPANRFCALPRVRWTVALETAAW